MRIRLRVSVVALWCTAEREKSVFQTENKIHNWGLLKIFYVFLLMSSKQWHTSNQMFVIIIFHMQENSEILHTYKVMKFSGPIIT